MRKKVTAQLIDQSSIVLFKNVCSHILIYPLYTSFLVFNENSSTIQKNCFIFSCHRSYDESNATFCNYNSKTSLFFSDIKD